jgi:hypothetical protein
VASSKEIREVRALAKIYNHLKSNHTGKKLWGITISADYPEESKAWIHFYRLWALLYRHNVWEERELYLEAQFEYWTPFRGLKVPPWNVLYGSQAWRKYQVFRKAKKRRTMSKDDANTAELATPEGPFIGCFKQSAYALRLHLNQGFSKEEVFEHLSHVVNPYFVASDPDIWTVLQGHPEAFGIRVRKAYLKLDGDSILRKALRKLWRKVCRQQLLIL